MNTEQYIAALKAHDWMYAYADDGSIYNRGKAERDALRRAQPEVDPDWSIWNQHCHPECVARPVFPKESTQ